MTGQYNASKAAAIHLSETLRIELTPLNVRVITLMPGGVESNIFANGPPPTELPKGSYYLPIEKQLARPVIFDKMETAKFARCVVESVLNGHSGKVWRGASAGMVSWMVRFMPQWLLVSTTRLFCLLNQLTVSRTRLCLDTRIGSNICQSGHNQKSHEYCLVTSIFFFLYYVACERSNVYNGTFGCPCCIQMVIY